MLRPWPVPQLLLSLFSLLLPLTTFAQTYRPGAPVEYSVRPGVWEQGTVEYLTPSGSQVIVRMKPDAYNPKGNTRAFNLDELRQPGQQPAPRPQAQQQPQALPPGTPIEYSVRPGVWELGTIEYLTPNGTQAIVRMKPDAYNPRGNTRAFNLDELRQPGQQPVATQPAQPPQQTQTRPPQTQQLPAKQPQQQPQPQQTQPAAAGPPLSQAEILAFLQNRLGDNSFQTMTWQERERAFLDLAQLVYRRGVNFRFKPTDDFSQRLDKWGTPSTGRFPIDANFGPPATTNWFFGNWAMSVATRKPSTIQDGYRVEGDTVAYYGTLHIKSDNTYLWESNAGPIQGRWRAASPAEMAQSYKGGDGLVLLNAKQGQSGRDWIVFKDTQFTHDTITVADVNYRTTREFGDRK